MDQPQAFQKLHFLLLSNQLLGKSVLALLGILVEPPCPNFYYY